MELKIGITGSSGFIGKKLTFLLDDLGIEWFSFEGNLLNIPDVEDFFRKNNINCVVHLVGKFDGNFEDQMKINFETTKNLLEIGLKYGLKKIIYTSTGAVYGEPIGEKSLESDSLFPNTFYGLSKKLTEDLICYYSQNYGIQSVILRFPNVYGEGNNKGVIFNFKDSIQKNKKITVFGNGEQRRNFLYIDDAVESILLAINYSKNDIFNIAPKTNFSLNEIIKFFSEKYDFEIEKKSANNNLTNLILDIGKSEKLLGFSPKYNIIVL